VQGVKELREPSVYATISNSLKTTLVRDGPLIGLAGGCYRGALSVATIADDKTVRCYGGWNLYAEHGTENVRCIRQGSGWSGIQTHSRFHLGDVESKNGTNVTVDVYFADRVYTPTSANESPCFLNGAPQTSSNCDWDRIFLSKSPEQMRNTSTNVIWVDYTVPGLSSPKASAWCDNIVYSGYQSYSMDPSPFSNFLHLVQVENEDLQVTSGTDPLVVHPDWILAGWSVDRDGTVDGTRASAKTMISLLKMGLEDSAEELDLTTLNFMDGLVTNQGLSMIDYIATNATLKQKDIKTLSSSVKIYVWAYGQNTRTSVLGLVVVIFGCVCVLARILIGLVTIMVAKENYTKPRSLTKLLKEALEHESVKADGEHLVNIQTNGRSFSFVHKGSVSQG
jgi:hypothetical protein